MQQEKTRQQLKLKIKYHLNQIYKNKKNHKLSQTIFNIFFEKKKKSYSTKPLEYEVGARGYYFNHLCKYVH